MIESIIGYLSLALTSCYRLKTKLPALVFVISGLTVTGDVDPVIKIKQGGRTLISDVISSPTHSAALSYIADTIRSHSRLVRCAREVF